MTRKQKQTTWLGSEEQAVSQKSNLLQVLQQPWGFPWGNLPLWTCLPFVKLNVANLLSLRSFNPATVPQPQPEPPQPCSASTTHLTTGGPSHTWPSSAGSSWATVGSPFALLHSKNSSSAWENHSLPCTVLKAAVLLAHYLPFVHGEVTWLISERQIPRKRNY